MLQRTVWCAGASYHPFGPVSARLSRMPLDTVLRRLQSSSLTNPARSVEVHFSDVLTHHVPSLSTRRSAIAHGSRGEEGWGIGSWNAVSSPHTVSCVCRSAISHRLLTAIGLPDGHGVTTTTPCCMPFGSGQTSECTADKDGSGGTFARSNDDKSNNDADCCRSSINTKYMNCGSNLRDGDCCGCDELEEETVSLDELGLIAANAIRHRLTHPLRQRAIALLTTTAAHATHLVRSGGTQRRTWTTRPSLTSPTRAPAAVRLQRAEALARAMEACLDLTECPMASSCTAQAAPKDAHGSCVQLSTTLLAITLTEWTALVGMLGECWSGFLASASTLSLVIQFAVLVLDVVDTRPAAGPRGVRASPSARTPMRANDMDDMLVPCSSIPVLPPAYPARRDQCCAACPCAADETTRHVHLDKRATVSTTGSGRRGLLCCCCCCCSAHGSGEYPCQGEHVACCAHDAVSRYNSDNDNHRHTDDDRRAAAAAGDGAVRRWRWSFLQPRPDAALLRERCVLLATRATAALSDLAPGRRRGGDDDERGVNVAHGCLDVAEMIRLCGALQRLTRHTSRAADTHHTRTAVSFDDTNTTTTSTTMFSSPCVGTHANDTRCGARADGGFGGDGVATGRVSCPTRCAEDADPRRSSWRWPSRLRGGASSIYSSPQQRNTDALVRALGAVVARIVHDALRARPASLSSAASSYPTCPPMRPDGAVCTLRVIRCHLTLTQLATLLTTLCVTASRASDEVVLCLSTHIVHVLQTQEAQDRRNEPPPHEQSDPHSAMGCIREPPMRTRCRARPVALSRPCPTLSRRTVSTLCAVVQIAEACAGMCGPVRMVWGAVLRYLRHSAPALVRLSLQPCGRHVTQCTRSDSDENTNNSRRRRHRSNRISSSSSIHCDVKPSAAKAAQDDCFHDVASHVPADQGSCRVLWRRACAVLDAAPSTLHEAVMATVSAMLNAAVRGHDGDALYSVPCVKASKRSSSHAVATPSPAVHMCRSSKTRNLTRCEGDIHHTRANTNANEDNDVHDWSGSADGDEQERRRPPPQPLSAAAVCRRDGRLALYEGVLMLTHRVLMSHTATLSGAVEELVWLMVDDWHALCTDRQRALSAWTRMLSIQSLLVVSTPSRPLWHRAEAYDTMPCPTTVRDGSSTSCRRATNSSDPAMAMTDDYDSNNSSGRSSGGACPESAARPHSRCHSPAELSSSRVCFACVPLSPQQTSCSPYAVRLERLICVLYKLHGLWQHRYGANARGSAELVRRLPPQERAMLRGGLERSLRVLSSALHTPSSTSSSTATPWNPAARSATPPRVVAATSRTVHTARPSVLAVHSGATETTCGVVPSALSGSADLCRTTRRAWQLNVAQLHEVDAMVRHLSRHIMAAPK